MRNEVYCKFIAHNICCAILSQVEQGIEPVFWSETTEGAKGVETMPTRKAAAVEKPVAEQRKATPTGRNWTRTGA